jgi:hypothetical protein
MILIPHICWAIMTTKDASVALRRRGMVKSSPKRVQEKEDKLQNYSNVSIDGIAITNPDKLIKKRIVKHANFRDFRRLK